MAADEALAVSLADRLRKSDADSDVVTPRRDDGSADPTPDRAVPAVLRLYSWARPTASFGRNEPTRGVYDAGAAADLGVDLVRRPTGGRAVLHDAELTYSVIVPARLTGAPHGSRIPRHPHGSRVTSGPRALYHQVNEALVQALRSLGAEAGLSAAPEHGTPPLDSGPCFRGPAEGEVTVEGRKLVGSAQARIGGAFLQHGSIILSGDQTLLHRLLGPGARGDVALAPPASDPGPATLAAQIGPVDVDRLAAKIVAAMKKVFGGTWVEGEYSETEKQMVTKLVRERYASDAWTWRR